MKAVRRPLPVARTHGSRIVLADGCELIDGIASWWTACHGYNHPHIRQAVERQLALMPHVMFGGLVHEQALTLARRLAAVVPGDLSRVFFSESGSVAVEIAMKMAMQFWVNQGVSKRKKFVTFRGGYHGDTTGAMAVSDPGVGIHAPFRGLLPEHHVVELPQDDETAASFARCLERHADELAGMIVEPLVQGAGGMRFHADFVVQRLREAANRYQLLLIFDEIFTGFGRTGSLFACEAAGVLPDIITLSKAVTGGTLPLAVTIARDKVFDAFWSDEAGDALPHGPTFMANALACAAANASLDLFERESRLRRYRYRARPGAGPCALSRPSRRQGRAGEGSDRRGGARAHRRSRGLARAVRGGGGFRAPVRLHRLSHAGIHNRRGGARKIDGHGRQGAAPTRLAQSKLKPDDSTVQVVLIGAFDPYRRDLAETQRTAAYHVHRAIDLRRVAAGAPLCKHRPAASIRARGVPRR
jgi:adenosylmethionine-8-amino-7-oxononanoate aminotransferase